MPEQQVAEKKKRLIDEARLPVYNDTRRLYEQVMRSTQKVSVNLKRGAVNEMEHWLFYALEEITNADMFKDRKQRLDCIRRASRYIWQVSIRVRALFGLGFIKETGFSALTNLENLIQKQLAGWAKKTSNESE